jgi:tRNA (Thr-GGU) A37 N-methylase
MINAHQRGAAVATETAQPSIRDWIQLRPVGVIRTGLTEAVGTPIQPVYAPGAGGQVIVEECFAPAIDDLDGFDRVWLLYWMDRVGPFKARVMPYRDTRERGLFATRSPCRPNSLVILEQNGRSTRKPYHYRICPGQAQ